MLPFNNPAHYGYVAPRRFSFLFGAITEALGEGYLLWQPTEPSYLAACEDPQNLLQFIEESTGRVFPLEQTNQMWLEYMIMLMAADGEIEAGEGLISLTKSRRDEKNTAQRHPARIINKEFGMIEFEGLINFAEYLDTMERIVLALGFKERHTTRITYAEACIALHQDPETHILTDYDEKLLSEKVAPVVLLTHFPERTQPFFNMARSGKQLSNGEHTYLKADLIIDMECAGGAEREKEKPVQKARFYALPGYADALFNKFGEAVKEELDFYMSLNHITRSGCGIGLSRLSAALDRYSKILK